MSDANADSARAPSRLLTGDLRRTVFFLALPVLFEQFLQFCVGFYDTYLSGEISAVATAAIGLAAYVGWLASMMFGLVATGTTALVARTWGAGRRAEANQIANRSVALSAVMGGLFFAFIWLVAPLFARLLDMHGETARVAVRYLRLDASGHIFTSLSLVGAAALRGTGDMRSPMLILGLVSVLNVLVSTALVYGFGPIEPMGIDGIVAGTVIARFCGGALMLAALARGLSGLKLMRSEWTIRGELVQRILRVGVPAAVDGGIVWFGQLMFLVVISRLEGGGSEQAVFAAHIIGMQVEAITYLPAVAWGYAAATLVGQSLGAGDANRAIGAGHEAVRQCGLLALVITGVFFFGAELIYGIMHDDAAVRSVGVPAFRWLALFQVPTVTWIVYIIALRGAGDTRTVLLINVFGVFCVRLPLAYLCGIVLDGGLMGAWVGMYADVVVRAILGGVRFARGRWTGIAV